MIQANSGSDGFKSPTNATARKLQHYVIKRLMNWMNHFR